MTRTNRASARGAPTDLVVVGGGVIGLATAAAAADRGLAVTLFTTERPGAASRAAAGLLVPHYSGEGARDTVARFMTAARDMYRPYVAQVEEQSGIIIPFTSSGAVEVARSPEECASLHAAAPGDAALLTAADVAALEPALAPSAGGVLYPRDGAVDSIRLTDALASIVRGHRRVRVVAEPVARLAVDSKEPVVTGGAGTRVEGRQVVLAAGAWAGEILGLPRRVPVRPLRGQICTVRGAPLRHVILGSDVYMVTRGGDRTLVGSTMEDVGFDARTTASAIEELRRAATEACPVLGASRIVGAWSGLRPATPDLLPILGPDPEQPELVYACGHSRNGILLAPITAAVVSALAAGEDPGWDLSPFAIGRFAADTRATNHRDYR